MSEPIRLPLSPFQRKQIADLQQAADLAQRDLQTVLRTIIGAHYGLGDPMWTARVAIEPDALVLTAPPAPPNVVRPLSAL